jgi:hypothetical protein
MLALTGGFFIISASENQRDYLIGRAVAAATSRRLALEDALFIISASENSRD